MTKKQFIKRMTEFVKIKIEVEKINKVLFNSPLNEGNWQYPMGCIQYEDLFINTMSEIFNDQDVEWIWYWVDDCQCGKKQQLITINATKYKLKTLDDLYNLLTNKYL
jgi:hypothetical protein